MRRRMLAGLGIGIVAATALVNAQTGPPQPVGGGRLPAASKLPTEEQWAAMNPKAKEYVEKARALAGSDPDLQFDFGIFCKASGGSQNGDRATIGVPNSEPRLQPFPAPRPAVVVGGQRLFDNFYWIGNTGIGAWLITSDDGYILFDTMNSEKTRATSSSPPCSSCSSTR